MIGEKRFETTPVEHIRNLMESIEEGELTITYYDDTLEPSHEETYDVSCTKSDAEEFIFKYQSLTSALESIAKVHDKLENGENPEEILTPEEVAVWNTYVRKFEEKFDSGEYDLNELLYMNAVDAQLSEAEQGIVERYYDWYDAKCQERLPKIVRSPKYLVNRTRRYEWLASLDAPKVVVDEEGRCLAEQLILYYYCTK